MKFTIYSETVVAVAEKVDSNYIGLHTQAVVHQKRNTVETEYHALIYEQFLSLP